MSSELNNQHFKDIGHLYVYCLKVTTRNSRVEAFLVETVLHLHLYLTWLIINIFSFSVTLQKKAERLMSECVRVFIQYKI